MVSPDVTFEETVKKTTPLRPGIGLAVPLHSVPTKAAMTSEAFILTFPEILI
jgi:hypothetical protein